MSNENGMPKQQCKDLVDFAIDRAPFVKFMIGAMEKAGCKVDRRFFHVERCSADVGGGFRPPDGVVICHNHMQTEEEITNVLTHELIHAFDHCRAADLDWSNCEHHACSEIRAAALSGDCSMKQELLRGNMGVVGQLQNCVKRRATLSVTMNPNCPGDKPRAAVESCFDKCFADTAPFDRIP